MKPIDIRNQRFKDIQASLQGRLQEVYHAWLTLGPGTTRILADKAGIDILNIRPRTTDLLKIGLVELIGQSNGEGIYRARNQADWESWAGDRLPASGKQLKLL